MNNEKDEKNVLDLMEQLEKLWEKEDQMLKELGLLEEDQDGHI